MDQVPCELCSEMVEFESYEEHARACTARQAQERQHQQRYRISLNDEDVGLVNIEATEMMRLLMNVLPNLRITDSNNTAGGQAMPIQYTMIHFSEPEEVNMNDYEFNTMLTEIIGNVETGIKDPEKILEAIEADSCKDEMCPICQDTFGEIVETIPVKTVCGHLFCKACISKWVSKHKNCPICQVDMEERCNEKIDSLDLQNETI